MKMLRTVLMTLALSPGLGRSVEPDHEYRLVWADEFDIEGKPNPTNWTCEQGFVRNEELQWYQADNAFCEEGKLVIEGRREPKTNPAFKPDGPDWRTNREYIEFTSACLTTKGRQAWQYGRFEVKARISARPGLWPAIWFLGVEGEWPSTGEIDLMEFYHGKIHANACWGTQTRWIPMWDSYNEALSSFNDPEWGQKFHLWRMDWDAESIKLYLDDRLLNTIDVAQALNPSDMGPPHPFRQPHYLLLNLAIGGTSGGDPSQTPFPTRYEIEYVRVFQKPNAGE